MSPQELFAARLREVRLQRGMSQAELARVATQHGGAITQTVVTRLERREREVTIDEWLILARALNTSPLALLLPAGTTACLLRVGNTEAWPGPLAAWLLGERPLAEYTTDGAAAYRASLPPQLNVHRLRDQAALCRDVVRTWRDADPADVMVAGLEVLFELDGNFDAMPAPKSGTARARADALLAELDRRASELDHEATQLLVMGEDETRG